MIGTGKIAIAIAIGNTAPSASPTPSRVSDATAATVLAPPGEGDLASPRGVDPTGIEPVTSCVQSRRSPI